MVSDGMCNENCNDFFCNIFYKKRKRRGVWFYLEHGRILGCYRYRVVLIVAASQDGPGGSGVGGGFSGCPAPIRDTLSEVEAEFADAIADDVQIFISSGRRNSVLVFPPVNNRRRFLIHRTAEEFGHADLATFSIGKGDNRRTVVCYGRQIIKRIDDKSETMVVDNHCKKNPPEKNRSGGENAGVYRPPQARMQQSQPPHRENPTRVRRPDRAVYVPKAKRLSESPSLPTNSAETSNTANSLDDSVTSEGKINKTPRPSKSKKTVDKNFCNVYQPPHARLLSSCDNNTTVKNVRLELSESLPQTEFCVIQQEVPQQMLLNSIVPISEQSPLPFTLSPTIDAADTSLHQKDKSSNVFESSILDSVSNSESQEVKSAHICESQKDKSINVRIPEEEINTNSCDLPKNKFDGECTLNDVKNFYTVSYQENVVSSASPAIANIEYSHNITADPSKCVNLNLLEKSDKNSHSVNNYEMMENGEKEEEITIQNINDDAYNKSSDSDIMANANKNLYNSSNEDIIIKNSDKRTWDSEKDEDKEQNELIKATEEINRSNRRLIKQSFVNDVLLISTQNEQNSKSFEEQCLKSNDDTEIDNHKQDNKSYNPNEEDWEAMFDENGEWLEPELVEELTAAVGKVTVQKPKMSYTNYLETAPKGFSHVLEVYNFPSEFTSNDLLNVFSDFKDSGFEIKWVDDNHALAVFSSAEIAAQVLVYNHPMVKTRPLYEATHESRAKAKKSAEFLKPYKPRPETCTALARRLVSGALGIKLPAQAQERLQEKEKIFLAREKKRLAALHREAAWDGSLTSDL